MLPFPSVRWIYISFHTDLRSCWETTLPRRRKQLSHLKPLQIIHHSFNNRYSAVDTTLTAKLHQPPKVTWRHFKSGVWPGKHHKYLTILFKWNGGLLFRNFLCLKFLIASPGLLLWIHPNQRMYLSNAWYITFTFLSTRDTGGDTAKLLQSAFCKFIIASQWRLRRSHYLSLCNLSIFPNLPWVDWEILNQKQGGKRNTWDGALGRKNNGSATRTQEERRPCLRHSAETSRVGFHSSTCLWLKWATDTEKAHLTRKQKVWAGNLRHQGTPETETTSSA